MSDREQERREMGQGIPVTLEANESLTLNNDLEIFCVIPNVLGATIKGTYVGGFSVYLDASGNSITYDTHLSTTGATGGAEVALYGPRPLRLSSASVPATSPGSVTLLIGPRE